MTHKAATLDGCARGTVLARAQAILLDSDGTLVDSTRSVEASWDKLLGDEGAGRFEKHYHGQPARRVLRLAMPEISEERLEELFNRVEGYEIASASDVEAFDGTARFLSELEKAKAALSRECWAIATSCTRPLFEARYRPLSLPFPSVLVTADQVTHGKPDPEPYLLAAERLGVEAKDCLVVEDAPGGLESARAAGAFVVGVLNSAGEGTVGPLADLVIPSLADVSIEAREGELVLLAR